MEVVQAVVQAEVQAVRRVQHTSGWLLILPPLACVAMRLYCLDNTVNSKIVLSFDSNGAFKLVGVKLVGVKLVGVKPVGFKLVGFKLVGFTIVGVKLVGFKLVGFKLVGVKLVGFKLVGVKLVGFTIVGVKLVGFKLGLQPLRLSSLR